MIDNTDQHSEQRIKLLEMIQNVIARVSTNGAMLKRFAVLVTAASVSFAKFAEAPSLLALSAFMVGVFAVLDAGHLSIERSFRELYDEVRAEPHSAAADFRMTPLNKRGRFFKALASWSIFGIYAALAAFLFLASILIGG